MSPNGTSELNQNLDPNGRFRGVAAIACRPAPGQNGLPDPNVWTRRALQEKTGEAGV
jgi:hypothetical protein